jgi:hypothetical protein
MASPVNPSRRRFLQVGAVGSLLSLPELLQAKSASAMGRASKVPEQACIFIVQQGGASHIDMWDLKPSAPEGYRGPYKPIATTVPGMRIGELLPRISRQASRCCLIRSMTHAAAGHLDGMHVCLSGQSRPSADAPYLGSIVGKLRPSRSNIPSYVWIQDMEYDAGTYFHTGGALGPLHAPLRVGKGVENFAKPGFRATAFDPAAGLTAARLLRRRELLPTLEGSGKPTPAFPEADKLSHFRQRAFDLVTGPEARRAFDLELEPSRVREHYGRHPLGQNLLAARRLIEAGVRLVSVHAFTGFDGRTKWPPVVNVWDMHGAGGKPTSIFSSNTYGLPYVLPRFDQAVSALLDDLAQRGRLESTLVIAVGEFGRTPKINGGPGRDHWPACYSALLAGGGVRGGVVYGASDKLGAYVKDRPVSPEDFAATVMHALGVDPDTRLGRDGVSRPASAGKPILALLG